MALCLMDHKKGKNMGQDNQLFKEMSELLKINYFT